MRVAFVVPNLGIFGSIRGVIEIANRLVEYGHEAYIYHPQGKPPVWLPCLAQVGTISAGQKRGHDMLLFVRGKREDIIWANAIPATIKAYYWKGLPNEERLGPLTEKIRDGGEWQKRPLRQIIDSFEAVVNSPFQGEWLKREWGKDSTFLSGGVNTDQFRPEGLSTKGLIVHTNDPRERKGTADVKDAFALAQRIEPKKILDLQGYYGKKIDQDKMARFYSSGEVFVDGQHWGGWNNPVVEAMACGVPVVCTDTPMVRDIAVDAMTALTVNVGDVEAMANGIVMLARDRVFAHMIAEMAHDRIINRYNWRRVVWEWLEEVEAVYGFGGS